MGLLEIARLGHPVLLRVADPVDPRELATSAVQALIDDMLETMREERGIGLAAPQVYRSLRLFVMDPGPAEPEDRGGGARVIVNPVLTFPREDRVQAWEGCLSIPGLRGRTERFAEVDVEALDREGRPVRWSFRGLPAVVVQHETDHLDGILFPRRMPDLSYLAFEDQLDRLTEALARSAGDLVPDDPGPLI